MNLSFILLFFFLFVFELIYLKIAQKYNITDHPNLRSSHIKATIRGGGIIFTVALICGVWFIGYKFNFFLIGLFLISLISFIDDVKSTSNKVRFFFHLTATILLFYQLHIYNLSYWWIILGFIFVIGTINAVNFMDGINGITGGFGLITILSLYYINKNNTLFIDENYLIVTILALLVFNFFNFRLKAICFAGDVGSISLAFIILCFLLQLITKTNNFNYLLLLLVYGLDTVITILFRVIRRENIFKAHRSHFYQFLANEKKIPHLLVATLYTVVQGLINFFVVKSSNLSLLETLAIIIITVILFIIIRLYFEGVKRLLTS